MPKGKIYLVPTVLNDEALHVVPAYVHAITQQIDLFFVENERTARRYLRKAGFASSFDNITMTLLDSDNSSESMLPFLMQIEKGRDAAILSEAGVPAVADPGSGLVRWAHIHQIQVVPLVGPSSIILSLMASGLNGQRFCFHGYLAVKSNERKVSLKQIEQHVKQFNETQIFIETPYRNNALIADVLQTCQNETRFCIASELTGPNEYIQTKSIREWKSSNIHLDKIPAIFLLGR